jgi:predicted AlkP superfamily pyrophosphatase or phosphodiesterase
VKARLLPYLLAPVLCGFAPAGVAEPVPPAAPAGPALLVMISVDQLRADLLERYDPYFTGGFRRLLDQGARFTAVHDHSGSETGPGHATLSTGVYPSHSGIVANDWLERVGDRWISRYNVADSLSPIVGFPEQEGRSPRNLLRTGVADWVAGTNGAAKVLSVSGKDRSAVLMTGKAKGTVLWFDQALGRFISSTYYMPSYPEWVERFNREVLPTLFDSVWVNQAPAAARALARPDTAAYEADAVHSYFPHRFSVEQKEFGGSFSKWVGRTPFVDRAVLRLIEDAIPRLGVGQDSITDFLSVGLSQTDYVGHRYGPLSQEQLDNLIRLDRELGEFFSYLDRTVGTGRWVAVLSADHGSTTMPEWQVAHGQKGVRLTAEQRKQMETVAQQAAAQATPAGTSDAVASALRKLPFVADAYTFAELERGAPRDSFVTLFRHSFYPFRVDGDFGKLGVQVRLTEGALTYATGTGHGTAYFYDRVVPLIFLGGDVKPSRSTRLARTVDLAPTLATLGGILTPTDLDGTALDVPRRP